MNEEEKKEFKDTMHRRNTQMVEQTLREQDVRLREQATRIDGLHATLSGAFVRLEAMEREIALLRIARMGNGATS